jgi:predicted lipid-binding transport protein (Tim44 family)
MRNAVRAAVAGLLLALACLPAFGGDPASAAAASPQAKAYEALQKAIAAGDYEGLRHCMSKATLEKMDGQTRELNLDPKKMMELMKMLALTEVEFKNLKVEGKTATLEATGKLEGEANRGTIVFSDEDGRWKIDSESWTNTPEK